MPRARGRRPVPRFPWAEFKHAVGRVGNYFKYHTVGRIQRLVAKLSRISWPFTRRRTTRNRARARRARKEARRAAMNNDNNNNDNRETTPSPPNTPIRPTGFSSPPSSNSPSPAARQPLFLLPAPPSSRPATPSPSPSPSPPPSSTPSPARHIDNGDHALWSSPGDSPGAQLLFEQAQRPAPAPAVARLPPPRAPRCNVRLLAEVDPGNIVHGGRVRRQTEHYQ